MLKTMEKLMDRLTMDNRGFNREQADPQIRNPNFRRPNPPVPPQNWQRDLINPRNQEEQHIPPPFLENYVADEEDPAENEIHLFGELNSEIYLTEEEHNMFEQEGGNEEFEKETKQYQRGYLHAMDDVQRKIRLRKREVFINKGKANPNQPSTSSLNVEKGKEVQKESFVNKEVENEIQRGKIMKQVAPIDVERVGSGFNLQNELSKLKIYVPFNELLRNNEYRDTITKMVKGQGESQFDIL